MECPHSSYRRLCPECEAMSRQVKADLDAAAKALADFEANGGTSLEDLRKELEI